MAKPFSIPSITALKNLTITHLSLVSSHLLFRSNLTVQREDRSAIPKTRGYFAPNEFQPNFKQLSKSGKQFSSLIAYSFKNHESRSRTMQLQSIPTVSSILLKNKPVFVALL